MLISSFRQLKFKSSRSLISFLLRLPPAPPLLLPSRRFYSAGSISVLRHGQFRSVVFQRLTSQFLSTTGNRKSIVNKNNYGTDACRPAPPLTPLADTGTSGTSSNSHCNPVRLDSPTISNSSPSPGATEELAIPTNNQEISAEQQEQQQQGQQQQLQRPSYQLAFTCKPCGHRSAHIVSKQGYHKGTVVIKCTSCNVRHVLTDHLKIFHDRAMTLEDILAGKGEAVKKAIRLEDGTIEFLNELEGDAENS